MSWANALVVILVIAILVGLAFSFANLFSIVAKSRDRRIDALIALSLAVVLATLGELESIGEGVVGVALTFLAGLLSGRYRILLYALVASFLIGFFVPNNSSRDNSLNDLSLVLQILVVLGFLAAWALIMAAGVFLRRRQPDRLNAVIAINVVIAAVALTALALRGSSTDSSASMNPPTGTLSSANALEEAEQRGLIRDRVPLAPGCSSVEPTTNCSGPEAPPLRRERAWYVMPGTHAKVARDPSKGMEFQLISAHRRVGIGNATPIDLSDDASAPIPVSNDRALFFANTNLSTDMVLLPSLDGVVMLLIIRGPTAPSEFSWRVVGSTGIKLSAHLRNQDGSLDSVGLLYTKHGPKDIPFPLEIFHGYARDNAGHGGLGTGNGVLTELRTSADRVSVQVAHSTDTDFVYPLLIPIEWNSALFS